MSYKTEKRPHDVRVHLNDECYTKLWEIKQARSKPFERVIEEAINLYFEKLALVFDETYCKTWKKTRKDNKNYV